MTHIQKNLQKAWIGNIPYLSKGGRYWKIIGSVLLIGILMGLSSNILHATGSNQFVKVINMSTSEHIEGLEVVMQEFDSDIEISRSESLTNSSGIATFELETVQSASNYTFSVLHNGIRFFSDPILEKNHASQYTIQVYDSTNDPSIISITSDSAIVFLQNENDGILDVIQITTFKNSSNYVFGGDSGNPNNVLEIPLPPMAFDVESIQANESSFTLGDNRRIYTTFPALPGSHEIIISYKSLYTKDEYVWRKNYKYPFENVQLSIPNTMTVEYGDAWTKGTISILNNQEYVNLTLVQDDSAAHVELLLKQLPLSKGAESKILQSNLMNYGIWITLFIVLIFGLQALYFARKA